MITVSARRPALRTLNESAVRRPRLVGLACVSSVAALAIHGLVVGTVGGLVGGVFFGLMGIIALRRRPALERDLFLVVAGVATISVVLIYHYNNQTFGAPYWNGGSDDLAYEEWARSFRDQFSLTEYGAVRRGGLVSPSTGRIATSANNSPGYIYLISLVGRLLEWVGFTNEVLVYRLLNAMLLGLAVTLVFRIALQLGISAVGARRTALAVGFQPLLHWIAGHTLRDILIMTLVLWLVLVWVRFDPLSRGTRALYATFVSLIVLASLTQLRLGQAYVLGAVSAVGLWRWRGSSMVRRVGMLGSFVALLLVLFSVGATEDLGQFMDGIDRYTHRRIAITGGGLSTLVFETPYPAGAALRIAYLILSPIPTLEGGLPAAILGFATLLNASLVILLVRGIRQSGSSAAGRVLLATFAGLFMGVAGFTFTIRQIVTYLPLAGLLIALGYQTFDSDARPWIIGSYVLLMLVFIPYLLFA